MPSRKTSIGKYQLTLDARPDRIDFRDRSYQPPLISLPNAYPSTQEIEKWIPEYTQRKLVLDQGSEGACTGFGLAAMINHIIFRLERKEDNGFAFPFKKPAVSAYMLYRLAQLYDEWPGEDYEGSSCRGAMKGWHKHGVCSADSWKKSAAKKNPKILIDPKWREEAPRVPLGAYYRINKDSISDMQAAIHETGAIYVSCNVFDYWGVGPDSTPQADGLPIIAFRGKRGTGGGHAFCLVGYREEGFIVQNSWGPGWGNQGFAILAYDEWVQHGSDAWVATLGAPTLSGSGQTGDDSQILPALAPATFREGIPTGAAAKAKTAAKAVDPYEHMLILGNDGGALQNRHIDALTPEAACERVLLENPRAWLAARPKAARKIALYFHGGLNSENAAASRAAEMTRVFLDQGIYPIFIAWQTGPIETIKHQLGDVYKSLFGQRTPDEGIGDWFADQKKRIREKFDRSIETAARTCGVKGLWSEMKENAERSCLPGSGLDLAIARLARLAGEDGASIHLVGHSAGSILIGALLQRFQKEKLKATSCHLYAPACSVPYALRTYAPAIAGQALSLKALHIDLLDDERERADNCGALAGVALYGRSLLYLVSLALETQRKTPIFGMELSWNPKLLANGTGLEFEAFEEDRTALHKAFGPNGSKLGSYTLHTKRRANVKTRDGGSIPLAHGSFDDDKLVVEKTLQRILAAK